MKQPLRPTPVRVPYLGKVGPDSEKTWKRKPVPMLHGNAKKWRAIKNRPRPLKEYK